MHPLILLQGMCNIINYKKLFLFAIHGNNKLDDSNKKIRISLNELYEFLL